MNRITYFLIIVVIFSFTLAQDTCEQKIIDQDAGLYQCENCSFSKSIEDCSQSNCATQQFYSKYYGKCLAYCQNLQIAIDQSNCSESTYSCIDGYYWNYLENKCNKQKSCVQGIFDSTQSLFQCMSCILVSDSSQCNYCDSKCLPGQLCYQQYNINSIDCYNFCGNGQVTRINTSCNNSQMCLSGFLWNNLTNKCQKCDGSIYDQDQGLYLCNTCYFASAQLCVGTHICDRSQVSSRKYSGCFQLCGNSKIARQETECISTQLCLDGYQWNDIDKSCQKCKFQVFDTNFNLYQCPGCFLVNNYESCSQNCPEYYFYSINQNKCMYYCGEGKISNDILSCKDYFICVDQFSWSDANQKCIQNQQNQCFQKDYDNFVKQCSNCSLVNDINDCQNECITQELPYYLKYQGCRKYCGNKIIANLGQDCANSYTCIDGYEWRDQQCSVKQCYPTINDSLDYGLTKCSNCSLVQNETQCNQCQNSFYYDGVQKLCMKYCGNGKITKEQDCTDTNITCVQGFFLSGNQCTLIPNCSNYTNEIDIIQCPNCSFANDNKYCNQSCGYRMYYYVLLKKCMFYCQNKIISSDNICATSHICIDGYQWDNEQYKCIKGSEILCPENQYDNYVKQCTNCNLISNNNQQAQNSQSCQNSCKNTQNLYFSQQQNKCMYYCQKGIIANDVYSCQTSQICVEGYVFSQGQCNPEGQVNQNSSTNDIAQTDYTLLIIVIVVFAILILIIFISQYLGNKKFLDYKKNQNLSFQKIEEKLKEAELKIIEYQQETSTKLISIQQTQQQYYEQLKNNQIVIDFNNENQDLNQEEEQHSSQQTIVQIQNRTSNNDNDNQSSQQQLQYIPN